MFCGQAWCCGSPWDSCVQRGAQTRRVWGLIDILPLSQFKDDSTTVASDPSQPLDAWGDSNHRIRWVKYRKLLSWCVLPTVKQIATPTITCNAHITTPLKTNWTHTCYVRYRLRDSWVKYVNFLPKKRRKLRETVTSGKCGSALGSGWAGSRSSTDKLGACDPLGGYSRASIDKQNTSRLWEYACFQFSRNFVELAYIKLVCFSFDLQTDGAIFGWVKNKIITSCTTANSKKCGWSYLNLCFWDDGSNTEWWQIRVFKMNWK